MSEVNPYAPEAKCQVCNESFPEDLIQTYVNEKTDKKGNVTHDKVKACPLCVADLAGKRAGLKTPFDFKDDPEMSKKVLYAQHIRDSRSKKKSSKSDDDEAAESKAAEEEAELKRKAEEDAEAQRQLDAEEAERQRLEDDGATNMLETEQATQLEDETPKRRGGRGSN